MVHTSVVPFWELGPQKSGSHLWKVGGLTDKMGLRLKVPWPQGIEVTFNKVFNLTEPPYSHLQRRIKTLLTSAVRFREALRGSLPHPHVTADDENRK